MGKVLDAPDVLIARVARRQHGLVTIVQLGRAGLGDSAVKKRVAAGRLHRVGRGVYAVGHASLSRKGRWMAAVLGVGEGAALSHLAAAKLWEIWRRRADRIDVVSPRRSSVLCVHWTRHLDPRDISKRYGIPVTTVPRTLVDLTDVLTPHQLANVIHEAAFRNRFSEPATRAAMERANGRKLKVLEKALEMNAKGSAGTESDPEDQKLAEIQAAGLPEPLVNVEVEGIEVDLHWPERKLCLEVDGHGHARPRTRREDAERDQRLRAAGYEVMRASANPS
jgi:hypothetical protein